MLTAVALESPNTIICDLFNLQEIDRAGVAALADAAAHAEVSRPSLLADPRPAVREALQSHWPRECDYTLTTIDQALQTGYTELLTHPDRDTLKLLRLMVPTRKCLVSRVRFTNVKKPPKWCGHGKLYNRQPSYR